MCPTRTQYPQQFPCPPGTYHDATGITKYEDCTDCPAGKACKAGSSTSGAVAVVNCAHGHYCPVGTITEKQFPCPAGTYSMSTSLSAASGCTDCPDGYYCPPGSHRPYLCPTGYSCDGNDYDYRTCAEGYYTESKGQAEADCEVCPVGYFCPLDSTSKVACPKGTYLDVTTGMIAEEDTSDATRIFCKPCTAGYKCPDEGMSAPTACAAGYYSPASSTKCFECLKGKDCSAGAVAEATMETSTCPAGSYCASAGSKIDCPVGYYCPAATDDPVPCPRAPTETLLSHSCWRLYRALLLATTLLMRAPAPT